MYVRVRQRNQRLLLSLLESKRDGFQVVKENVAYLGSVPVEFTVDDRIAFWRKLHERMARLGNRVSPDDQAKIFAAVHARGPMVTLEEQRSVQLRNAAADAEFWSRMREMNQAQAEEFKGLAARTQQNIAGLEASAADAGAKAAAAKDRVARIERGEEVPGGLGKPFTAEDIEKYLLREGFTKRHIAEMKLSAMLSAKRSG